MPVSGCGLLASPRFFACVIDMKCKPEKHSLRGLLAGHFAGSPLDDLVVTLADMLGASGKLGARMLGAEHKVGFAA